ncbi:MAG: 6,7-dimethyl-8-ribityllumazine synthase [Rickettsiales bacterium]|jgi:6,7-dimethyl-8-ribityllumazine synthase|nr:6,7-dimethyl-8-ribityllumazine synthase [Rickettsiales bacterium]
MTHILIINSRFYPEISEELSKGAVAVLKKAGASYDEIEVPGAFEVPAAIAMAEKSGKYDGYVALGCVIRGETTHYDYVCGESARGLMELAIEKKLAIGYGILTVENEEQAEIRADIREGNKGGSAAHTCLTMLTLKKKFGA